MPAPPPGTDEEVLKAINAEDKESYRIPTSLSSARRDKDKGELVFACMIYNSNAIAEFQVVPHSWKRVLRF